MYKLLFYSTFLIAQLSYGSLKNISYYTSNCEKSFLIGNFKESIYLAKKGLSIQPNSIILINYLIQSYFYLNEYSKMKILINDWIKYAEKINNNSILTIAYNAKGTLILKTKKLAHIANLYYKKALKYAEKEKSLFHLSSTYHNMGYLYLLENDLKKAEYFLLKAIQIKNKINDTLGLISSYNELAELYKVKEKFDKSLEYYEISLNYANKFKNSFYPYIIYNNMAHLFFLRKNFTESLKKLNIILNLLKDDDYIRKSNIYLNIAIIHIYNLDYLKAMKNVKLSLLLKVEEQKNNPTMNIKNVFKFERELFKFLNKMQFKFHLNNTSKN